jgi:hypothetical protein
MDNEKLQDLQQQMDTVDTWRNPDLTDVDTVYKEMGLLIQIRIDMYPQELQEYYENNTEFYVKYNDVYTFLSTLSLKRQHEIVPELIQMNQGPAEPDHSIDKNKAKQFFDSRLIYYVGLVDQDQRARVKNEIMELSKKMLIFRQQKQDELTKFAKETCPYSHQKFSTLLQAAVTYDMHRIQEFQSILVGMLENIKLVQLKKISQKECTDRVLNKDIGTRFYNGGY